MVWTHPHRFLYLCLEYILKINGELTFWVKFAVGAYFRIHQSLSAGSLPKGER